LELECERCLDGDDDQCQMESATPAAVTLHHH